MAFHDLIIGIKRGVFRVNDAGASRADAEFAAKRDGAKAAGRYKCIHCGWVSKRHIQVHHLDDNHRNNAPENFGLADQECHAYHHVGEPSKLGGANDPGGAGRTAICAIPEITPQDLNLLMRAMSIAYVAGGDEMRIAQKIHHRLATRREPVVLAWGSVKPEDFAAAMSHLKDAEYRARHDAVAPLRIVFRATYMHDLAARTMDDYPIMGGMKDWANVAQSVEAKCAVQGG